MGKMIIFDLIWFAIRATSETVYVISTVYLPG